MCETNEWKLEIRRANNGYILKGRFGDSEIISEEIIELDEKDINIDIHTMQKVLWTVMEYFGVYYSKHSKKNLVINIEKNKENESYIKK